MGSLLMSPLAQASSTSVLHASYSVPDQLMSSLPIARLHFTGAINAKNLPALKTTPQLRTRWEQIGTNEVQAVTSSTLVPLREYALQIPTAISCTSSCKVTSTKTHWESVAVSVTQEEQLLAQLNYLPVSFTPAPSSTTTTTSTPTAVQTGTFAWRFTLPAALRVLWRVGSNNVILRGAVMRFQSVHNLPTTGIVDPATWFDLLNAVSTNQHDPTDYNYVYVSQKQPETLVLYKNGIKAYSTTVNTGISQAPTEQGTYPVYLRFVTTTMSGTNPDGTKYHDTGIPWVSYFNGGDALHGFIRSSYGYPQSLGCVEMPFNDAKTVYPSTPIGTLVTIQ